MANYNEMKESITKRIAETGSPKLYVDLASAAMAGNKDAMNELEKELGITVHTMAEVTQCRSCRRSLDKILKQLLQ